MALHTFEEKPRVILPRASRGNEILAILFSRVGLLLALCLVSAAFYPNDPSWNSAGQAETHNWAGSIGANVAATAFQFIGLAAYLLPLLLFAAAWRRFHTAATFISPWTRIAGWLMLVVAASALLSISQCVHCLTRVCNPADCSARSWPKDWRVGLATSARRCCWSRSQPADCCSRQISRSFDFTKSSSTRSVRASHLSASCRNAFRAWRQMRAERAQLKRRNKGGDQSRTRSSEECAEADVESHCRLSASRIS